MNEKIDWILLGYAVKRWYWDADGPFNRDSRVSVAARTSARTVGSASKALESPLPATKNGRRVHIRDIIPIEL